MSSSTISRSTKSRTRSRRSTTVTPIPSMAKIDAYSIPMTPPPTTVIARGNGDHDRPGAHRAGAVLQLHHESVGVLELSLASDHRDVVAPELVVEHVDLPAHDVADPYEELLRGRTSADGRRRSHGPHRLAERLARNRPRLDADSADAPVLLDDRDVLPELRGLDRGALACRPAPNRHEVEVEGVAHGATLRPRGLWGRSTAGGLAGRLRDRP